MAEQPKQLPGKFLPPTGPASKPQYVDAQDLESLRWFTDSPDAGLPECLCSKCGQVIDEQPVIRLWNNEYEIRLHLKCFREIKIAA